MLRMAFPHNEHILHDLDKKFEVKSENVNLAGSSAFSVVTPKGVNQVPNVSTPSNNMPKQASNTQVSSNPQTPSTPRAPFTLPGLGIERHTTQPYLNYPKELLSYMFLPFNKGMVLPPEYPFGIPGMPQVPDMRNQVPHPPVPLQTHHQPHPQPHHQPHIQPHPQSLHQTHHQPNGSRETAPSITRDAPSMQHIRLAIEDRDSGNESSSLSPPYSFSSSRSPSHSSRSNSFSMSSLLRPSENHQAPPLHHTPIATNTPQTPQVAQQAAITTPNTPSTPTSSTLTHRQLQHPGPPSFMLMPHTQMMNMSLPYNQQYMQMQLEQLRAKMATEEIILPGREVCEVCGDNASGFHYGVMSCEGCKGFFRRSVQKSMNYQCHRDGSCKVDRISRNRCQACRFQKCLSKGMTKESVRNDRVRKRKTSDDDRDKEFDSTRDLLMLSNDVIRAYRMAFPDNYKIISDKDAQIRCLEFVKNISAFQGVREQFPQIVQNSFLGLMHLRFAKSEFPTDDVNINMKLISRLQQGLKNITEEELALLSAIHCANPIQTPEANSNPGVPSLDGASNPVWEKLVECLRVYRSSNNSSDKNQLFSLLQLLYQLATLSV